ncbi:MAG: DUF1186 domain-containing protein [Gammaproteobacteria bacterium]
MDTEALFTQLEFNTGEFPKDTLTDAVDQRVSIMPLLLEELRHAAADPETLLNKGESYIRHIYAMYLLAQFREASAYSLLVDFVAAPGEVVMDLTGDVVTEDLGRMLASVCHGNLGPIKRLIEGPEVNEWVRSAAISALVVLYTERQLERETVIGYLNELFLLKIERKPGFVWSAMVNAACDLYPEELVHEIKRAYGEGLVNPGDVSFSDVQRALAKGKEEILEDTRRYAKGLIGNVVDEISWWACFRECDDEEHLDRDPFDVEDDVRLRAVKTVMRPGPKIGRNDPCPCGSGKKYKKCCIANETLLH